MIEEGTVNSQVVDAVSSVVTLSSGQSPSQSQGMLDAVLLETLSMAMYNAVNRQQSAGMIGSAAVTAACAKMLSAPFPVMPPPPPPGPLPVVNPLPGPAPDLPPSAVIAAALSEGQTAIQVLQAQATGSSQDAATAKADLQQLATAAQAPAPTPAPAPAPTPTPTPAPPPHGD